MTRHQFRIIGEQSWKLRMKKSSEMMAFGWSRNENNSEMLRMGKKRIARLETIWEDGNKLEQWIFGRTGKDLRGTLLRSSKSENDEEKYHQNYWDTPEQWIIEMMNQRWKNLKDLGERHMTDDNPFLRQTLKRIFRSSGKIRRVR